MPSTSQRLGPWLFAALIGLELSSAHVCAGQANRSSERPSDSRDPSHPLRDPRRDPGTYKPEKTEKLGPDAPGWGERQTDWVWGTLSSGRVFPTKLVVTNNCPTPEVVGIFPYVPFLSAPETVTIPGRSKVDVPMTISTPQPVFTMAPPGWDGVMGYIEGQVVVWHPWRPGRPECLPNREVHTVVGKVVYDASGKPPSPPPPPAPGGAAVVPPCAAWWNTGLRPPRDADDATCMEPIRALARDYRDRVLEGLRRQAPGRWSWLPAANAIMTMSIEQLLAMKQRAAEVLRASNTP